MVSINNKMSYIQKTVGAKETLLQKSVFLLSLGLLLAFLDYPQLGHNPQDPSGRGIGPPQISLRDNTQHSPDTHLRPCGIRKYKTSKPAVVDPRLRPHCAWGRAEPLAQYFAQLWNSKGKFRLSVHFIIRERIIRLRITRARSLVANDWKRTWNITWFRAERSKNFLSTAVEIFRAYSRILRYACTTYIIS
jgi:hypothetical protein